MTWLSFLRVYVGGPNVLTPIRVAFLADGSTSVWHLTAEKEAMDANCGWLSVR